MKPNLGTFVVGTLAASFGTLSLLLPQAALATDCSAAGRGISSFSCPGTPTGDICGAAPNYTCPIYAAQPTCSGGRVFDCNSCACQCPSGQILCSGVCQSPKPNTCYAGQTLDPCAGTCSGYAYALVGTPLLSPPQSGHMNITGDFKYAGDLLPVSGKAIRVDGPGITTFNFGNWGVGATGFTLGVIGTVNAQKLCLPGLQPTGGCITTWPAGGGGGSGTVTSITAGAGLTASPVDPITGAGTLNVGAGTGITVAADSISVDPAYSGFTNFVKKAGDTMIGSLILSGNSTNLSVGGGGAFGGYSPDALWKITTPNIYIGNGVAGTIIGAGGGQNAGDLTTDGILTVRQSFILVPGAEKDLALISDSNGVGSWKSGHCSSGKYDHVTGTSYTGGAVGGYSGANTACGGGTHICTPDEIIASVGCGVTLPASGNAWVANGAPGFTAPASNDCAGWTSSADTGYGDFWKFNGATGGTGYATSCSQTLPIACCR